MNRLVSRLFLAASVAMTGAFVLLACGDDDAPAGAGSDGSSADAGSDGSSADGAPPDALPRTTRSPSGSRPASVACGAAPRPAGDVDAAADGGECASDEDCDAGVDGRCRIRRVLTNGFTGPVCTYHACAADEDCSGSTSVCGCGVGWAGQNLCLTNSNCRTDSDCPTGQRCAFSDPPIFRAGDGVHQGNEIGETNFGGDAIGWFCTTPEDDCNCPKSGSSTDKCIYNLASKHWDCGYTF